MVKLRDTRTGMIVSVNDDKAERFDSLWVPADKPVPKTESKSPKPTPKK